MKRYFAPVILLMLCMTACTDADLGKVAKGLTISAQAIGVVQTTVIEANTQGLLTDAETAPVLQVCMTANQAGKDAVAIIRPLTSLDLNSKQMIIKIIAPAVKSIQDMLDANLLFIKNETTKQKVRAGLLTTESALNGIQLVLAGS